MSTKPDVRGDAHEPVRVAVPKHSLAVRVMHWVNAAVLLVMLWSGLRIYNANDVHAIDVFGLRFEFFPGWVYDIFHADHRLAKGIAYHLTFGWIFVSTGALFVLHLARRRRWQQLVPTTSELRRLPDVVAHELGLGVDAPAHEGKYNPAQKLAYTAAVAMGVVLVLTGFAIYKPTQLKALTWALGGYETARLIHFSTALGIVGFAIIHVVQVVRSGWRNFSAMVTGYEVTDIDPHDSRPNPVDARDT